MANYYYARVRVFKSTSSDELSASNLENNRVKTNLVTVADKSSDDKVKKQYAWYVVDVHKSNVSSFQAWSALPYSAKGPILSGDKKKVVFNWPTSDTYYSGNDVKYYTALGSLINVDGHIEFTLSNNLGTPRSIIPTLTITQNDATGSDVAVSNILWENDKGTPFTIKFTGAAGDPAYPSDTVAAWIKQQYGTDYAKKYITVSASKWSVCNKHWCYMLVDSKDGSVTFWYSDENGKNFVMPKGPKPVISTQPKRQEWNSKNSAAFTKDIDASACSDPGKVPPTTDPGYDVNVTPPQDQSRWNPPPHVQSRSVPYSIRTNFYDTATLNPEFTSYSGIQNSANFYSESGQRVYNDKGYSYLERGRIFQDALSAASINNANTGGKSTSAQWGFRFMYNPNSISYNTQQSTKPIDWTRGSKDTATLLEGNSTVTIQLYLNRIVDLGYLNALYGRTSNAVIKRQLSEEASYGRQLSDQEREGIMNRGTEYDLEFLYRCLTGDPIKNNPLLNDRLKKTGSADIGYITGIPLWMYLNDNMRYFGSITGFDVNHLIFNTEMVPTLSVVSVSFTRYPAQLANEDTGLKSIHNNFFPPDDKAK